MKKGVGDICYDCGCVLTESNRTGDHIPPKCMFPVSLRHDLIKVPCCYECNQSHKKEDEFLLYLAGDSAASISSGAIASKVGDSLHHGSLRSSFPGILQNSPMTEGNPYMRIPIDREKTFGKMVKGLLYELCGRRNLQQLVFHTNQTDAKQRQFVISQAKHLAHAVTKGRDVFRADWIICPEKPDVGMWWLEFFGSHIFFISHHHISEPFTCRRCVPRGITSAAHDPAPNS